jgi:YVTN family beta-propeller protein
MKIALLSLGVGVPILLGCLLPAAAGTLIVANKSDHTVDLIDPQSGTRRATLPTGRAPHEAAASPDGKLAVISNYGPRDAAGSTLTVIDVAKNEVLRTIELGDHKRPHGLGWYAADRLAVTTEESAHLLVVDPLTGTVVNEIKTSAKISHMVAVTPDGRRAFVANIGSGSVTAIDLVEGSKIKAIETGAGAEGIAVTPDGKQLWISNRAADTLTVLSTENLEPIVQIPCKGFPIRVAVTPDGERVLVSCARSGEIAVFDAASFEELIRRKLDLSKVTEAATRLFGDRFGESPVPIGLVVAPDGRRAWVAATQSDVVVVFDPATLDVIDLIQAGKEPDGMAYTAIATEGRSAEN